MPVEWAGSPDVDAWPALAVALASLSGWLEEAEDEAALLVAVDHGCSLALGGIFSLGDVRREVFQVVAEIMSFGAQAEGR